MLPREIVRAALRFQRPPRLPVRFGCFGCDDTAWLPVKGPPDFKPRAPGADEWGCVWARTDVKNMGQVKGHPLARYEADGKYVTAGIFMVLFERMHSLYGFENVLTGLLHDRPAMDALADHIMNVHLKYVENIRQRFGDRVHAIGMTDDWGTQQAAFVSLKLWMDFFFPRYRRIFGAMHAAGYDVWLHSCGQVTELVEGFIRAGADVVNLQQPRALGIERVGQRYRGRITFESLADIQATLPTNRREEVDADVAGLMAHWADPRGGFVFSDYGDPVAIGVSDPGIKLHMYRRFSAASEQLYGAPLPEPKVG